MKNVIIYIILLFTLVPFTISGCSDDEVTKVVLELEFDSKKFTFFRPTLIDRILCFFSTKAYADVDQTIKDNLISVSVDVYVPGGGVIHKNFDLNNNEVIMNIPSGPGRVFDLRAYIHTNSNSAALTFRGVVVANLFIGFPLLLPDKSL